MSLLGIDAAELAGASSGTEVHHHLTDHPLLTLDALGDLADRLPAASVEHHLSDLPEILSDGQVVRLADATPGEIVRGVAENRCWAVLWNIEQDPGYARLLDDCLAEITPHVTPGEEIVLREGFLFISAPGSVTPAHIDPEHNVLLQVVGEKTMTLGRFPDDAHAHRESERIAAGGQRWLDRAPLDEHPHRLVPGVGVYVPPYTPHRVANGDGLCVSLSVTWRTASHARHETVYRWNAKLRRFGLDPVPPGASTRRDAAKHGAWHGLRWALHTARTIAGRAPWSRS